MVNTLSKPLRLAILALCLLIIQTVCNAAGSSDIGGDNSCAGATSSIAPQLTPGSSTSSPKFFNVPISARSGDIVGVQGNFFGLNPKVEWLNPDGTLLGPAQVNGQWTGRWIGVRAPSDTAGALRLRLTRTDGLSSPDLVLNGPKVHHLDSLELVPGGTFRIFGRNLLWAGYNSLVCVNGLSSHINFARSDAYVLEVEAPLGLKRGPVLSLIVNNGNGSPSASLDRPTTISDGHGSTGVWALDLGWTAVFAPLARRIELARQPTTGAKPLVCDGIHDDSPALQDALIRLARSGGGTLQLPQGICRLMGSSELQSGVVLQGAGSDKTTLRFSAPYALYGHDIDRVAIRDLTMENIGGYVPAPQIKDSSRVVLQNLVFLLGGSYQAFFTTNRSFIVQNCRFEQPINHRTSGPLILSANTGFVMWSNTIKYAHGAVSLDDVHDADIRDNHIVREVYENAPGVTRDDVIHGLAINFSHHIAIRDNRFDLHGGPVRAKFRNDGEAILTEGGGPNRTERTGVARSAGFDNIVDPDYVARLKPDIVKTMPENFGIAVVSGAGAGQTRRIVGVQAGKITVDTPWDQVPEPGSRFATFRWGLEKALIKGNQFTDIPRAIWLYQTAIRDVDLVDNRIQNGGGIYLRSVQLQRDTHFTPMFKVRIMGNSIENTSSEWAGYVSLTFVRADIADFGIAFANIEIRDNKLRANRPNLHMPQEEAGYQEGFTVRMRGEGPDQSRDLRQDRIIGTIIQNNQCIDCESPIAVREGTSATVQDGNTSQFTTEVSN